MFAVHTSAFLARQTIESYEPFSIRTERVRKRSDATVT